MEVNVTDYQVFEYMLWRYNETKTKYNLNNGITNYN